MSLINDALRDLDARQVSPSTPAPKLNKSVPRPGLPNSVRIVLILLGGALLFLGGLRYAERQSAHVNTAQAESVVVPLAASPLSSIAEPDEAASPPLSTAVQGPQNVGAPAAPVSANVLEEMEARPSIDSSQRDIQAWLERAAMAMDAERYTLPEGESALTYYQRVLAVSPEHGEAQEGLASLQRKYRDLMDQALTKRNAARLDTLLARAPLLLSETEIQRYAQRQRALLDEEKAAAARQSQSEKAPVVSAPQDVEAGDVLIQASAAQQLRQLELQVAEWRRQAQWATIEGALAGSTARTNTLNDALMDAYLAQSKFTQAMQLLRAREAQGEHLPFYRARLLQVTAGDVAALQYLNSEPELDVAARTMYAGLLQQTGRYADAAAEYKTLLSRDEKNASAWLGLAVSADKLADATVALSAYRRASQLGDWNSSVATFIRQRLAQLGPSVQADVETAQW